MATLEDLMNQSSSSSPIQPLQETTLPGVSGGTQSAFAGLDENDPRKEKYNKLMGQDEWQWDTPSTIYDFGEMRLKQQLQELNVAGPTPTGQRLRSMGGVGGVVYIDETKKYEELEREKWERQKRVLRERQRQLSQREPYQYPITDIV